MTDLFEFMKGYASWAEFGSAEKYLAALEEAVNEFNRQEKETNDFYDILEDYMEFRRDS